MNKSKIVYLFGLLMLSLLASSFAVQTYYDFIQQEHGTIIYGIGISVTPSSLDWGNLTINSTNQKAIIVTNTNITDVKLTLDSSDEPSYLELTWDYANQIIASGKSMQINMTLKVLQEAINYTGPFSFNIIITGTAI